MNPAESLRQTAERPGRVHADARHMAVITRSTIQEGTWRVDGSRSTVGFSVRHFGVATVAGRFGSFAGRLEAGEGELRVEGTVDVASVDTHNAIRDARLRAEFFDAALHPAITLRASGRERLDGEVTIRGVTRPVALVVRAREKADGTVRVWASGTIRRSDFGLDWEALRDARRLLVADEVKLMADAVLTRDG